MGNTETKIRIGSSRRQKWKLGQIQYSYSSAHSTGSASTVRNSWSRASRRSLRQASMTNRYDASKTPWPVSTVESQFLPEFPIRGQISERNFEILKKAARGAFGVVLQARKIDTGTLHAMKVLAKHRIIKENAVQQCKAEVNIQSTLGYHPFIVRCQYKWQNRRYLFIVTDYIPYGDMLRLWKNYGSLPEMCVKIYAAELALTLDFLHNAGVVYRDLKLENILLDAEGHIQLIDFGLAKWLNSNSRARTICGTIQYMAPEILRMEPYTHAVDWWSLGIVIYVLLTGQYPVKAKVRSHSEMCAVVEDSDYQLPDWCSEEAKRLTRKLLCKVPQKRIQSAHVLKWEPFFRDLSFDDISNRKISPKKILEECLQNRKDVIKHLQEDGNLAIDDLNSNGDFRDFDWVNKKYVL